MKVFRLTRIYTMLRSILITLLFCGFSFGMPAQNAKLFGKVEARQEALAYANVALPSLSVGTTTDSLGFFTLDNIPLGNHQMEVSYLGYKSLVRNIQVSEAKAYEINFDMSNMQLVLDEVVITGTLKESRRLESPVAVEVFTPVFFKKNPTPNIYDALQNVNGIRPQLNCQVCNTGDIHINGLEGPYTMILVDGMPIVSALSTVYGLSGIPNAIVDRIEVVKGPASSLYGSEAVGGLINVITKHPNNAPRFSADVFGTSWGEYNADLSLKFNAGKKVTALTGINYFNFQNRIDRNEDDFTDMTLQHRVSVFQKWNFLRKKSRAFNLAMRYMYEDRWGGDVRWQKAFRGGDELYGESIYTGRWEVIGNYQLPVKEKLLLSFSFNDHDQNSYYGTTAYMARQKIAFSQMTWDKKLGAHDILAGAAMRFTFYDDNTPGTADPIGNNLPQQTWLPGLFVQDEIGIAKNHSLLMGMRIDRHSVHGGIFTPRLAYKWTLNSENILRLNAGTGFRVVNLFTEDHAALTGARKIEIKNNLDPEQSYNANLNFVKKIYASGGNFFGLDASAFYTYFTNRIVGDYESDPDKIIYDNLDGHAVSKGLSLNLDMVFYNGLKIMAGATWMENTLTEHGITTQQILTEKLTGTWAVTYKLNKYGINLDYTGNVYSPMRLPVLGPNDPRKNYSPWWSIQNIQMTYDGLKKFQIYGGVKNFLNFTPQKGNPFLIARSHDPFDKGVEYDQHGKVRVTDENPFGLTFDPNYVYAPNQGLRLFLGVRYTFL